MQWATQQQGTSPAEVALVAPNQLGAHPAQHCPSVDRPDSGASSSQGHQRSVAWPLAPRTLDATDEGQPARSACPPTSSPVFGSRCERKPWPQVQL